ncbi:T9SS type A sorting domain-containing protein [Salinibacter ruber]|uniref:Fibronectin type-III domain-containing protein n=1 Tax=Salinibacter ruber TaxID=146919 RepID=A0A9X2UAF8_9BACT|nr:T9SS type A sorting domain-containing protein [Salinibacter ruber]MCS3952869.1 hypothetical protein [Salinibacter ruber]MCS4119084.1 hypothetical protein [Salinibacter ruber]MCS4155390.1 hypothetical protein [Salinibacter ruber]
MNSLKWIVILAFSIACSVGVADAFGQEQDPTHGTADREEVPDPKSVGPEVVRTPVSEPEAWSPTSVFSVTESSVELEQSEKKLSEQQEQVGNRGTEFWLLFQRNYQQGYNESEGDGIFVEVSSEVETSGIVEIPGIGFSTNFTVEPDSVTRIQLPDPTFADGKTSIATDGQIENKGVRVTAADPIAVYGLDKIQFTTDGYLGLPRSILSTNYVVPSYESLGNGDELKSQVAVVSPRDENTVTITPSAATKSGRSAGEAFDVTLDQGEAYQIRASASDGDLTGTVVQSSLPVSVFSGAACANVPRDVSFCDHLIEQVPPTETWGDQFVTTPLKGRQGGDTFRILAGQSGTDVTINGETVATLDFGDYYETILDESSVIETSNPALVLQYMNGSQFDEGVNGDPFMMMVPPTDQFADRYSFSTPSEGFVKNHLSLTPPKEATSSIELDGTLLEDSFFTSIPNSEFAAGAGDLQPGTHFVRSTTDDRFGLYSYGRNDDDSYGVTGGLLLDFISEGGAPTIARTSSTIELGENQQPEGDPIPIEATITDDEAPFVQSATVYHRPAGESEFSIATMTNVEGDLWRGNIPMESVIDPGVEYYIAASDGQLESTSPSTNPEGSPYSIAVFPNEPPQVEHTRIQSAPPGESVTLEAQVVDSTDEVSSVELRYRVRGGNPAYDVVNMSNVQGDTYEGTIPGEDVTVEGIDYYISGIDNFGVSTTEGTPDQPIEITVSDSPTEDLQIGPLTLTADQIQEVGEGTYEATGNVSLGGILSLSGTVTANVNTLTIEGESGLGLIPSPVDQIYNGSYELSLVEEGSTFLEGINLPGNSTLQVSGFDVEISGIELLTGDSGPGIRVEGKLVLPDILDGTKAEVSQVQVTAEDGLDLAGEIGLNEPVPLRAATLNELSLSFNTVDEPSRFAAEAGLDTRLFGVMGGGVLLGGELDSLGFEVEPGQPVPIASTGMALAKGGGRVDNLATDKNIVLGVSVDIVPSAGPASDVVRLRELSLEYEFGERVKGSGNVDVFEQPVASASVRAKSDLVGFEGQFGIGQSIPKVQQDIISSGLSASVTERCYGAGLCSDPSLRLNGSMVAATRIPALGGGFPFGWLSSTIGLPYQGPSIKNILKAKPLEEEGEIRAETRLEVCWKIGFKKCVGKGLAYGIAYDGDDPDPLSADFARNLQNLNLKLFPKAALKIRKAAQRDNRFEGKSLIVGSGSSNPLLKAENDSLRQGFTLREEKSSIIVRVEGEATAPEYSVTGPSGTLSPQNPESAFSFGAVFNQLESENKAFFLITDPTPGEWSVNLPDDGTEYAVDIIGEDPAPALDLEEPSRSGGSVDLSWEVSDPSDEVSVDLYADTDQSGQDGVLIAEDVSPERSSLSWSLSEVPTGTYYVYAVADDGKNPPVVDYATEPIQVVTTGAPSPPTGVTLTPSDTALTASWNGSDDADRYIVYYAAGKDLTLNSQDLGVRNSEIALTSLPPGREYHVAVTALDSEGRQSGLSDIKTVSYESQTQNNTPLITTTNPAGTAREGEVYRQTIEADDADGDPLSYELATSPEGMTVGSDGEITWDPKPGTYSVEARVSDPAGAADSLSWQVRAFDREGATASLAFSRSSYVGEQATGQLVLVDPEASQPGTINSKQVRIQSRATPQGQELVLRETQANSGRFRTTFDFKKSDENRPVLDAEPVDTVRVTYEDQFPDTTVTATSSFYEEKPPRFSPKVLAPSSQAEDLTTFPTLTWAGLEGIEKYGIQVAVDSNFQDLFKERVVKDTSLVLSDLQKGTTYYWRVRGETVVEGPWSDTRVFETRPKQLQASVERSFEDAGTQESYRLVALPGALDVPLDVLFDGEPGTEWQAWWDDGSSSGYYRKYDGSNTFRLGSGRGFWVSKKGGWSVDREVETVQLNDQKQIRIPVHDGWNIIANPFGEEVSWNAVNAAHSDSLRVLWRFDGSFAQADTFRSARVGEAFYFLNDSGLDSLKVPYPTGSAVKSQAAGKSQEKKSLVTIRARSKNGDGPASAVKVGFDEEAAEGLDRLDEPAPPGRFSELSLRLQAPGEAPPRRRSLMTERRPPKGGPEKGHTFDLRLQATTGVPIQITASGLEENRSAEAKLLRPSTGRSYDLVEGTPVAIEEADSTGLKLAIGSASYVEEQAKQIVPDEVRLTSYPNPTRGQATIEYTLPEAQEVTLEVYDVLGRRVATLENGRRQAGRHTLRLDGGSLPSGVYFGRLEAGEQTRSQKITVVR